MAEILLAKDPLPQVLADAACVALFEGEEPTKDVARAIDQATGGLITRLRKLKDFRGRFKETRVVPASGLGAPRLMLVGLGKPGEFSLDGIREVAARVAVTARDHRLKTVAMPLMGIGRKGIQAADAARAAAEGVIMGLFDFREFKSPPEKDEDPVPALDKVFVCEPRADRRRAAAKGIETGRILGDHVNLARTLILRPSISKAPEALAEIARAKAKEVGIHCQVLEPAQLQKLGMGALLGVGAGSARPPRLVVLEYKGGSHRVLLCGKGITFDSGGINIKPSEGMEKMKYDMSGSATVLAAILAAARLKLRVHVMAIMALAENMPSGTAIRPGDVLTAYNKKTIEVANTDAEGRLVLADALSYGVEKHDPQAAIDVATLTGAVRIALGAITTGIMGNDDALVRGLIAAGKRTGDDLWQLPLHKAYERQVKSDIADVKNVGAGGMAGAIAGAAFLKQFVGKTPWAHLDIAGTGWTEKGPGDLQKEYLTKGPTGIGVRLLVEWMSGR